PDHGPWSISVVFLVILVVFLVGLVFLLVVLVVEVRALPDLLDVRTDVGHFWAVDPVLAVAALVAAAPPQHDAVVALADADVVPAPGAVSRSRGTAPERAGATDVVAAVVARLGRTGEPGNLIGITGPLERVRAAVRP